MKTIRVFLLAFGIGALLGVMACAPATTPPPPATSAPQVQSTAAPPTAVAANTQAPTAVLPTSAPASGATNTPRPTPTPPPPQVTAAPGAVKIQFWHALTGASQVAELQKLADQFNAANPQYYIQPILQGNYADTLQKMNAAITANSLPDMILGNPGDLGTYDAAGVMLPLDDYIKDPKDGLGDLAAQIDPSLFFDTFDNRTIGISTGRSIQVMYYNADMLKAAGFDKPPATFEEFEKVCEAVSKPPDTYCYAMVPGASVFANLDWNFGGEYASADETKGMFDDAGGVATLEWIKKLADKQWAYIPAAAFGDQTDFGNGKVAFTVGSTAGLPFYQKAVEGSSKPFTWGIAPLPRSANGKNYVDLFGPSIGLIQSTPEKQKGAWEFLKFLLSSDIEQEWAQVTTYFPANRAAANAVGAMDPSTVTNKAFASVIDKYKLAVTFLPDGKREPSAAAWQSVRNIVANMMTAVFTGKSGADFSATEPAAAAKEGVERVNKTLSEFGK
ncbi:MAG: sn-glycerol-3-phosphate-binding periplasmic protein UgpB [Anaerolineae bacterium]|nr:sn-glycerol-3-phosphate-binding periplasmic protein UgpB [Anaerolineae bacterium]